MKKRVLSLLLALTMCLSLCVPAFAAQPEEIEPNIGPIGGSYYYTKRIISTDEEWSEYRRVSSNLEAGPAGGTLYCDTVTTFTFEFTGEISELGFAVGTELSSSVGHSINVPANRTAYLGYKVMWYIEEGIREKRSAISNQVLSENTYTVKIPQYGQYGLIFVD